MSSTRKSTKRACPEPPLQSLKKQTPNEKLHDDLYLDVSSDLKGIMLVLQKIREKAHEEGRKKMEESISSYKVLDEISERSDNEEAKRLVAFGLSGEPPWWKNNFFGVVPQERPSVIPLKSSSSL
ncbi:unnamed protein product [Eruca vesicaria subsp. sativa]|uniref:Uncharacterized protein n=1 Tax=Eruca vesicaria subsp. sativa TaxID=29727 RepID=A0ABC8LWU0_ERUVS|nr:unnamed protein product [Eruca vesicaria subsp. sativa]